MHATVKQKVNEPEDIVSELPAVQHVICVRLERIPATRTPVNQEEAEYCSAYRDIVIISDGRDQRCPTAGAAGNITPSPDLADQCR